MNWINGDVDVTLTLDFSIFKITEYKTLGESFETEMEKSGPFEPDLVETSVGKWLMYVQSFL